MPTVLQSLLSPWLSDSRGRRYVRRYGDVFRVRLYFPRLASDPGRWPIVARDVVMLADPSLIQEVAALPDSVLSAGEGRRLVEWFLGAESVLVLDGREHARERRRLTPLFATERVDHAMAGMRAAAAEGLRRLPSSGTVSLVRLVDEVVLDVALRMIVHDLDERTALRLRRVLRVGHRSLGWSVPLQLFPWLRRDHGRWSPGGRIAAMKREVREVMAAALGRRQGTDAGRPDLLGQLAELETGDEEQWRLARLLSILGGFDTVAVGLSWCCYHLLRHPDAMARARDEARSADADLHGQDRTYLDAVCREAVRLHPPLPILGRRALRPIAIRGFAVDAGTYVVMGIGLAHRKEGVYPDPDRFRPERFLERDYGPEEYVPFGGGSRRCLGQALAFPQMRIVLRELLRALDFVPTGRIAGGARRRTVMISPRDPLRVRFVRVPGRG
jgi:cytochrome P450